MTQSDLPSSSKYRHQLPGKRFMRQMGTVDIRTLRWPLLAFLAAGVIVPDSKLPARRIEQILEMIHGKRLFRYL
jgi:hypothetical protein